jgi:hypothetical protein
METNRCEAMNSGGGRCNRSSGTDGHRCSQHRRISVSSETNTPALVPDEQHTREFRVRGSRHDVVFSKENGPVEVPRFPVPITRHEFLSEDAQVEVVKTHLLRRQLQVIRRWNQWAKD